MTKIMVFQEHFLVQYLKNRSTLLHQFQTENDDFITNFIQSAVLFLSKQENWKTVEQNVGIFILFCTDIPDSHRKNFAEQLIQTQANHASLFSLKLLNALR